MRNHNPIIYLLIVLLCALPVHASQSPQQLVRDTSTQILMAIKKEQSAIKREPTRLYELVEEVVLPHFDFERMGRWVLGKHWRQASPEQQQAFVNEFRALLVRTYSSALANYSEAEIVFPPVKTEQQESRVTVPMEINKPNGIPVKIIYRLHRTPVGWKVFDVAIEGVSLVSNYRASFSSKIKQEGLDQLIKQLSSTNKASGST